MKKSIVPEGKILPRVGIIYSDTDEGSNESRYLAHYMCGLLALTGYAEVRLIGMKEDGTPSFNLPATKKLAIVKPGEGKPTELPGSAYSYNHWSDLDNCHVVLTTVLATDAVVCADKLGETLLNRKDVVVFCFQRGVKSGSIMKEKLSAKCPAVVVECVVGFAAVPHPKMTSTYVCTHAYPAIVMERLSKDIEKKAIGPAGLIESCVDVVYRKILTAHAWGVMIYENLYALNMLSGGSIDYTLSKGSWRELYAAMIREDYKALKVAAGGGAWKPDFELLSSLLTPWALEMLLILPSPIFALSAYLIGLPRSGNMSPGSVDMLEGKKSMTVLNLNEMIQVGTRNGCSMRVSQLVYDKICKMEAQTKLSSANSSAGLKGSDEMMHNLFEDIKGSGGMSRNSVQEQFYWISRILTGITLLLVMYFLFIHD